MDKPSWTFSLYVLVDLPLLCTLQNTVTSYYLKNWMCNNSPKQQIDTLLDRSIVYSLFTNGQDFLERQNSEQIHNSNYRKTNISYREQIDPNR